MAARENIELVTMDMWRPYWTVCRALLPKAQIVVDRWHVQRYTNDGLETIRKALRADLPKKRRIRLKDDRRLLLKRGADLAGMEPMIVEAWCNEFPDLGAAYAAKERFAEIWSWGNEADARAGIRSWSEGLAPEIRPAFQPLLTALTNWEAEIFAYFRHPITNAFTECMNGLAKIDNRMGRGYSFEALRAKILLKHSKPKVPRPGFIKGSPFKPPAGLGSGKLIESYEIALELAEAPLDVPMFLKRTIGGPTMAERLGPPVQTLGPDLDRLADMLAAIDGEDSE